MAGRSSKVLAAVVVAGCLIAVGGTIPSPAQTAHKSLKAPGLAGITGMSSAAVKRWTRLVSEAQQEGNLVFATGGTTLLPLFNDFGSEFGIKITDITGSPTQTSTRILAERRQGLYAEDIAITGGGTMQRLLQGGAFQPLLPNIILQTDLQRKSGWYYNKFPWFGSIDPTHKYVASFSILPGENVVKTYYNSNLVTKNDLAKIQSWQDLISPKYKGKIVMQNVVQGADANDVTLGWALLGQKYWQNFMKFDQPTVLPVGSDVEAVNGFARGQWEIAMFIGDLVPYRLTASARFTCRVLVEDPEAWNIAELRVKYCTDRPGTSSGSCETVRELAYGARRTSGFQQVCVPP